MHLKKNKHKAMKTGPLHYFLSIVVVLIGVARFLRADYYSVFLCFLTLLLFNIPFFIGERLKLKLPKTLMTIILLFIFSAEILGEIGSFYTRIPWWDTMLHTVNGFLVAAIGFSMIDILNNSPRFHINLSPVFVAFVAFCFSMTVGVFWEFFEFAMDTYSVIDMQKDKLVSEFASVALNSEGLNDPVRIRDITSTVINYADGEVFTISGGYLDIGISDTMKDLIVNCIGAFVFSIIGYFYIIGREQGTIASSFIPQLQKKLISDENDKEENEDIPKKSEIQKAKKAKKKREFKVKNIPHSKQPK